MEQYVKMIEEIEKKGKKMVVKQVCNTLQDLMKQDKTVQNERIFKNKVIMANAFLDPPDGYNNAGINARDLKKPIYTRKREEFLSILEREFLPN